ncbi:MAG: OmpH family outer membrane protein [Bacteroidia bacterium]
MMKNKTLPTWIWTLVLVAFVGGAGLSWMITHKQAKPVYYVKSQQLFEGFSLSKEYKSKLDNAQQARKRLLEQMELDVQRLAVRYQTGHASASEQDSLQSLSILLESKRQEYTQDNEKEASAYNDKIWSQLNQYLKDYCAEAECAYVLGANGSGMIMAADEGFDRTDEILEFVNKRYSGVL